MARAANMQALTDDVKRQWPGVVVYGIGDNAHKTRASDHNEDDTSGSKAAQSDPDGRAEHRAIDVMVGKAFTKADADALVTRLAADPKARARIYYVIWNGYIWSRSNGWRKTKYTGSDQHTDHIHVSGWAADDENTASWPAVATKGDAMPLTTAERQVLDQTKARVDALWDLLTRALNGMPSTSDGKTGIELQKWVREGQDDRKAILAQGAAVLTRVEALAGEERERDAALVDLVRQVQSGELAADQFVDEVARRLQG